MKYRYCPLCRGALKKDRLCFVCQECSYELYESPKPSVGVIFQNGKGEILLVRRARSPRKGKWNVPAGFTERGESLEDGVKREILEEISVDIFSARYFRSYPDTYRYQGMTYPIFTAFFMARFPNKKDIQLDSENSEWKFFSTNAIPFDDFGFASHAQAVKEFIKM